MGLYGYGKKDTAKPDIIVVNAITSIQKNIFFIFKSYNKAAINAPQITINGCLKSFTSDIIPKIIPEKAHT